MNGGLDHYRRLFGRRAPQTADTQRARMRLGFAAVATLRFLAEHGLLIGNPRGEWARIRCPVHKGGDERNASMSVSLVDGHFACHACGEKGPGIVKRASTCCVLAWAFAMPCETLGGASMSETPEEAARRLLGGEITIG